MKRTQNDKFSQIKIETWWSKSTLGKKPTTPEPLITEGLSWPSY